MTPPAPITESINLLLGILDGSPNGVVAYQPIRNEEGIAIDYKTVYYNPKAQVLLGYTEADFKQKTLFERFPEGRIYEKQYFTLIQQNQPFIYESFFTRAQCWLEIQARRLGDGFFMILSDITDRKKAETALVHQNKLLDGVINTFLNGITALEVVKNEVDEAVDFRVTMANDGALRLTGGHTRDKMLGKMVTELFPETRELGMLTQYLAVYNTGEAVRATNYYPVPQRWIDLSVQKTETGLLVTYNDITDQKQAEEQLLQSANMLKSVLNGVQSGVISYISIRDESGQIVDFEVISANEPASQIMQQSTEQLIGQRMLTLFPAKREGGIFDRYISVVETGAKQQFELETKNGDSRIWFDIAAVKQSDGIVLTLLNISERKQAQIDLSKQTDQLTAIFESSLNGIISMQAIRDEAGNPVDFLMEAANEANYAITGLAPTEIIGTRLLETFPGNDEAGFLALYQRVVTTGKPERTTQYYRDQNGLEAWFEVSAVRQDTDRVTVTFSDVTAAQTVQQQLRESNQSLEEFAGVASHDLQEPLRKVQSFGNLLSNQFGTQLGESCQDLISRMQNATDRMSILIKDLLAYSRLTSQPEPVSSLDMNVLVAEVLTDLETRIVDKQAVIDISELPTITCSSLTMRQLMQNLISNALKFSRPDLPPHIRISVEKVAGKQVASLAAPPHASTYWAIQVADNGIGFDERYKDRIFGAFQRLHSRNSQYPGTGIGLAIVKKVVEQYHGAIDAYSKPGEGATFTVYLPI